METRGELLSDVVDTPSSPLPNVVGCCHCLDDTLNASPLLEEIGTQWRSTGVGESVHVILERCGVEHNEERYRRYDYGLH
jgi:hypothetical protein